MPRIRINQFHNGFSKYENQGLPGQFLRGQGLNIRNTYFGTLQLNPRNGLNATPVNTPFAQFVDNDGTVYYLDSQGTLNKISGGTITTLDGNTGTPNGLFFMNGRLWYFVNGNYWYYDFTTAHQGGTFGLSVNPTTAPSLLKNGKTFTGANNLLNSLNSSNTSATELTLPTGYVVVDLCDWQEYLVILCRKRDGSGSLVYWGQDSTTSWDFEIPITETPQICWNDNGDVRVIAGNQPNIYKVERTFSISHLIPEFTCDPNLLPSGGGYTCSTFAKGFINGIFHFGLNAPSGAALATGIYSYGSKDTQVPPSLNCEYIISTGNTGATTKIKTFGTGIKSDGTQVIFFGWSDSNGATLGFDTFTLNSSTYGVPNGVAIYESLIFDAGQPEIFKLWNYFGILTKPLPANVTITFKYKLDDNSSWVTATAAQKSTVAPTHNSDTILLEYPFPNGLYAKRLQFRVEVDNSANAQHPQVTILDFIYGYEFAQARV